MAWMGPQKEKAKAKKMIKKTKTLIQANGGKIPDEVLKQIVVKGPPGMKPPGFENAQQQENPEMQRLKELRK